MAKAPKNVKGWEKLNKKLDELKEKYGKPVPSVSVGYAVPYAVYVHENLDISHPVHPGKTAGSTRNCGGQAKFLTQPMRENRKKYIETVLRTCKNGGSLVLGLMAAGQQLLADSRKLVPILTKKLYNSGFVGLSEKKDPGLQGIAQHVRV